MLRQSDFNSHIAPHTIKVVSMFSVMSRLKESAKCDLLTKMKIYNGDDIIEKGRVKRIDIKELRDRESQLKAIVLSEKRYSLKSQGLGDPKTLYVRF